MLADKKGRMDKGKYRFSTLLIGLLTAFLLLVPSLAVAQEPTDPTPSPTVTLHPKSQLDEQAGLPLNPPPPFDPTKLQPNQPLPGEDYPPEPLPHPGPPLGVQAKPEGIDLDATFINRDPKYQRYWLYYSGGKPYIYPGTENDKRWPDPGEIVTFTAHVVNKGTLSSGSFAYKWYIDGVEVQAGVLNSLSPGGNVTTTYQWAWAHQVDGERVLDDHTVRFVVDPENQINETFEINNQLEDRTNAMTLRMAITPQIYQALETPIKLGLPYSAEDWLQKHITAINNALAGSTYYFLPTGATERVRIDEITVTPTNPSFTLAYDGGWFMDADYRYVSAYYDPTTDIDWGLVHELSHQVGLIDLYRYNLEPYMIKTLKQDGSVYDQPYWQPNYGLMFGGDTAPHNNHHLYSSHSAAGISSTKGYRRGYYGEYQYDIASQIWLEIRDEAGYPVEGANVSLYQRLPLYQGWSEEIDNIPEIVGTTNSCGRFLLPNWSVNGSLMTRTGHTLRDNPFGVVDVVGPGNEFLMKFNKGGFEDFQWLPLLDLNLFYWANQAPASQTVYHHWNRPHVSSCQRVEFDDSFDDSCLDACWRWVDPNSNAQHSLTANSGSLRLSVSQGNNDLRAGSNLNAPRLLQQAAGNFTVTIQLRVDPQYDYQGAGLLLWQDASNYLRLERANGHSGQGIYTWYGQNGSHHEGGFSSTTAANIYLRLQRVGNRFIGFYSEDGASWSQIAQLTLPFLSNLEVGVTLINAGQDHIFYAHFDSIAWEMAEEQYKFYLPIITK